MKNQSFKEVALYARFSSDNQRSESIDAQIRAMQKYCEDRKYKVVKTYVDEAKSATTDKRPAFQKMIEDSYQKIFDIVLVHKLDRFSRNRYDSALYRRELKMNGVSVYSVLENLDDSPESVMMEALLEGMSEYYSRNLAREVMKGLRENAIKCKHTGGIPPLGYEIGIDKKLIINENEAEIVRLIYNLYNLNYGYNYIVKFLNQKGYKTKLGKPFIKNSIRSILTNEKYTGVYIFNKCQSKDYNSRRNNHAYKSEDMIIRVPNGCPEIIPKEIFIKAQQKMSNNLHLGAKHKAKEKYLLSGLIICGICNKRFCGNSKNSGRNKAKLVTYRCSQSSICHNKEINKLYLDKFVLKEVRKIFAVKNELKKHINDINRYISEKEKSISTDIKKYNTELSRVEQSIDNISSAIERGMLNENLIERLRILEDKKSDLEQNITERTFNNPVKLKDVDLDLIVERCKKDTKDINSIECKNFIYEFIDKIIVYRDKVEIILNTGLNISKSLNKTITISKKELYPTSIR